MLERLAHPQPHSLPFRIPSPCTRLLLLLVQTTAHVGHSVCNYTPSCLWPAPPLPDPPMLGSPQQEGDVAGLTLA